MEPHARDDAQHGENSAPRCRPGPCGKRDQRGPRRREEVAHAEGEAHEHGERDAPAHRARGDAAAARRPRAGAEAVSRDVPQEEPGLVRYLAGCDPGALAELHPPRDPGLLDAVQEVLVALGEGDAVSRSGALGAIHVREGPEPDGEANAYRGDKVRHVRKDDLKGPEAAVVKHVDRGVERRHGAAVDHLPDPRAVPAEERGRRGQPHAEDGDEQRFRGKRPEQRGFREGARTASFSSEVGGRRNGGRDRRRFRSGERCGKQCQPFRLCQFGLWRRVHRPRSSSCEQSAGRQSLGGAWRRAGARRGSLPSFSQHCFNRSSPRPLAALTSHGPRRQADRSGENASRPPLSQTPRSPRRLRPRPQARADGAGGLPRLGRPRRRGPAAHPQRLPHHVRLPRALPQRARHAQARGRGIGRASCGDAAGKGPAPPRSRAAPRAAEAAHADRHARVACSPAGHLRPRGVGERGRGRLQAVAFRAAQPRRVPRRVGVRPSRRRHLVRRGRPRASLGRLHAPRALGGGFLRGAGKGVGGASRAGGVRGEAAGGVHVRLRAGKGGGLCGGGDAAGGRDGAPEAPARGKQAVTNPPMLPDGSTSHQFGELSTFVLLLHR